MPYIKVIDTSCQCKVKSAQSDKSDYNAPITNQLLNTLVYKSRSSSVMIENSRPLTSRI